MNKNAPKISEVGDKDLVQFSMDVINSERSKVPGKPTGDIPLFGVFNYKGGESILNFVRASVAAVDIAEKTNVDWRNIVINMATFNMQKLESNTTVFVPETERSLSIKDLVEHAFKGSGIKIDELTTSELKMQLMLTGTIEAERIARGIQSGDTEAIRSLANEVIEYLRNEAVPAADDNKEMLN